MVKREYTRKDFLERKNRDLMEMAEYREQLRKRPRLTYLFLELTDRCNMACLHCGSSCKGKNHTFLPKEDIFKVLDDVAEKYGAGSVMICLTGGEPMLHPQFYEIAAGIHARGFCWGMTTNGTLIDEYSAQKLAETGLESVSVSLDGLEAEHDFLRNRPNAFQRTVRGIRTLRECRAYQGILQVTTVVHKGNIHNLESVYEYVKELGIDGWRLSNIDPIGRTLDNQELLLDAEDFHTLMSYIKEKRFDPKVSMEVSYGCAHFLTAEWERMTRDFYFLCGAGIQVAGILCNGDIYACLDIERRPELVQGNVREDSFTDVWENRFREYRRDRTEECSMCKGCEDRRVCGGDSFHTWDFEKKEPKICWKKGKFHD